MNKIILLIVFSSFVFLHGLEFISYEKALRLQKQNNKIIMVEIMRSDCHYCAKMKRVFADEEMSKWIENRFISVELDLDFDELPSGFDVFVTPSFFFIDKNQKIIKKIVGAWSIKDFKDLVKNIK